MRPQICVQTMLKLKLTARKSVHISRQDISSQDYLATCMNAVLTESGVPGIYALVDNWSTKAYKLLSELDMNEVYKFIQTCHSIEMKKSGSDQQKIGIWGKKSGSWSTRLQKEITHPKRRLFVDSFF